MEPPRAGMTATVSGLIKDRGLLEKEISGRATDSKIHIEIRHPKTGGKYPPIDSHSSQTMTGAKLHAAHNPHSCVLTGRFYLRH